jgi:hypothetical protein
MSALFTRSKFYLSAAMVVLVYPWIAATGESLRYSLVLRDVVEARLVRYVGNNAQRESTLKQMFAETGCDNQHLSEQPVKGSKLPNVI